jgi:thiamine transport system permease protein
MRFRGSDGALLLPLIAFVLLFGLLPVALLFGDSLATSGGWTGLTFALGSPLNQRAISNSLLQGALSAVFAVALGYPAGVFVGRYSWPGRSLVRSLLLVPFLLPSLVVVLGILDLFGPAGLLSQHWPALAFFGAGVPGVVATNLVFNVPMVILLTAAGCESASPELEEAVATLGGSPTRAYRDTWGAPTWLGAAAGGLLTFLFSALSFAPPLLLCKDRCFTVEVRVYQLDQTFLDPSGAGVLALLLVLLFLAPTVAYLFLIRRLRPVGGRRRYRPRPLAPWDTLRVLLAAETAAVLAGTVVVLAAVLVRTLAPVPGGVAGSAWTTLFGPVTASRLGISIPAAVGNTLLFAFGASAIALLLTVPATLAVLRRPGRGGLLGVLLFAPLLVSPVVLAFALATFWRPLLGGESTVWALVIVSQATLALPFALQSLTLAGSGLTPAARESAQSLGASRWGGFLDADLPRLQDGLVTASLFSFALGLGEFTATNFLVTPRYTTLTVALYGLQNREFAVANAAAGLLLLLSLVVFLVIVLGGRRVEL